MQRKQDGAKARERELAITKKIEQEFLLQNSESMENPQVSISEAQSQCKTAKRHGRKPAARKSAPNISSATLQTCGKSLKRNIASIMDLDTMELQNTNKDPHFELRRQQQHKKRKLGYKPLDVVIVTSKRNNITSKL